MWESYLRPTTLEEALELIGRHTGARIVAGGTDVLVELRRGVRQTTTLIDITGLSELRYLRRDNDTIRIGALATHNDVISSPECIHNALPLAQASLEIGAPQIRARATIVGNLVTASPANDTIAALMALDAEVVLASTTGERVVALRDLYTGPRVTVMRPGELLREVRFQALRPNQRGLFLKLGLRRAQAISVVVVAFVLTLDNDRVEDARITLGCLAPTVVRATHVESFLQGKTLDAAICAEAGRLARNDARPIGDVRGSAAYRLDSLENLVITGLERIAAGRESDGWPERPVLLQTPAPISASVPFDGVIRTTINGEQCELQGAERMSLLDALRDVAGLTGSKEGCAEGECGSCTVWLNGQAIMACLTPAPQAHGGQITTIEGLAGTGDHRRRTTDDGRPTIDDSQPPIPSPQFPVPNSQSPVLHPLQVAFIRQAAVQCGFCIPGMLMAGAKLLDELDAPNVEEIRTALSGNLCRCTGYRKILDAVLDAAGATTESTND